MAASGFLIALEGIDGCGKSSQAQALAVALRAKGHDVSVFREPGDSEAGQELRRIFVEGRDVTPEREVELFLEDRAIDVRDNILPALARGEIVLMDRYYLSSVVYQGALGLDPAEILRRNEAIAPRPDLTLVLDIDPDRALERIRRSRGGTNSFEGGDYLTRVRALYLERCDDNAIVCVDADRHPDEILAQLLQLVEDRVGSAATTRGQEHGS